MHADTCIIIAIKQCKTIASARSCAACVHADFDVVLLLLINKNGEYEFNNNVIEIYWIAWMRTRPFIELF